MSLDRTDIISSGLLELYVAGLTTGEETQQVVQWAANYPEVKAELAAIEKAIEAHAMATAVEPAAQLKSKLMAAIAQDEQTNTAFFVDNSDGMLSQPVVRTIWKWLAAASVALLLVSSYITFSLYSTNKKYEAQLASVQKNLDSNLVASQQQQQQYQHVHQEMETMLQAGVEHIALNKTANAPGECAAKVFWNKKTGEVYIDPCHMIGAPAGKTYQLWAIVNGKPVDAGLVKTGTLQDKFSIQKMKEFKNAQAFAITLEKEGGSPTPTLEQMYVSGQA